MAPERELPGKRRKHVPLRTCIACRQKRPKRELIRVVRTSAGGPPSARALEVDPKGKRAGRGAYLCRDRQCWQVALDPAPPARKQLERALRCRVSDEDVAHLYDALRVIAGS